MRLVSWNRSTRAFTTGVDGGTLQGHNGGALQRSLVKSQMNWLRTIPRFVRWLVAVFLVAQLAGVVSSPRADGQLIPSTAAAQSDHQHGHDSADNGKAHHHDGHSQNLADTCCALHAYFAGVLPPVIVIETESVIGESLAVYPEDRAHGVSPGRLDRPPRPLR
jgi:hypothetical protein